jgi:hypothetical protein
MDANSMLQKIARFNEKRQVSTETHGKLNSNVGRMLIWNRRAGWAGVHPDDCPKRAG